MNPSPKTKPIEEFLESAFGRTSAIRNDKCIPKPIGCGLPVTGFDNALSAKEYTISGLCQNCQNEVFGKSGD